MNGVKVSTFEGTDFGSGQGGGEALSPGSKLLRGHYEILRYLSSGGFGITYLAKDSLNRTVVIKECFPEAFCSRVNRTVRARSQNYEGDFRSTVQLFIREAHALSRLDHSSVVGVHQVFEDNETAYMALDLVNGKDLLEIIETRSLSMTADMVRSLTLKLLDAIAHVHSQDLLHRDISPDNILVDKTGHPVLIDFGAAREEASRKSRALSSVLVVKDGYSPQEFYVAGSTQAPCSDLYALAATLVHVITGQAPPNSQARLAALASDRRDLYEPLAGRASGFEEEFLEAIDKAMNIIPSQRIQSAEDWALMIDPSKRVEMARAQAQKDESIDKTVMKLVETANACLQERRAAPKAEAVMPLEQSLKPEDRILENDDTVRSAESSESVVGFKEPEVLAALPDDAYGRSQEKTEQVASETPYVRVTSRAMAVEMEKSKRNNQLIVPSRRMSRYATVPVVFCAYLFYGHTILQYDEVNTATLKPLLAFGQGFGSWSDNNSNAVVVRRGTGS